MPDYDPKSIPILDDIIEHKTEKDKEEIEKIEETVIDLSNIADEEEDTFDLFATEPETENTDPQVGAIENIETFENIETLENTEALNTHKFSSDIATDAMPDLTPEIDPDIFSPDTPDPDNFSVDISYQENEIIPDEAEPVESALIDYHAEEDDDVVIDIPHKPESEPEIEPAIETAIKPVITEIIETGTKTDIESDTGHSDESTQTLSLETIADTIANDVIQQLMPELEQRLRILVAQALHEKLPAKIIQLLSEDS